MEVGGFFFDFEAVRTASSDRDAPRRYWKEQRARRLQKRKMYRKMLLLNKREREAAFHDKDTVFAPSDDKVERNSKGLAVVDNLEYKK